MKVAVVTAPGQVELREEPTPDLAPDELLVRIGACGLCTMERRLFSGEKQIYPVAPGHEVAGEVVSVGALVGGLAGAPQVGDRVTVDL
ncbi:MAG TPA: alcohol dehydrogenase catalytic domain-containing protein, partial [Acidimicrobiales bacterium]